MEQFLEKKIKKLIQRNKILLVKYKIKINI